MKINNLFSIGIGAPERNLRLKIGLRYLFSTVFFFEKKKEEKERKNAQSCKARVRFFRRFRFSGNRISALLFDDDSSRRV